MSCNNCATKSAGAAAQQGAPAMDAHRATNTGHGERCPNCGQFVSPQGGHLCLLKDLPTGVTVTPAKSAMDRHVIFPDAASVAQFMKNNGATAFEWQPDSTHIRFYREDNTYLPVSVGLKDGYRFKMLGLAVVFGWEKAKKEAPVVSPIEDFLATAQTRQDVVMNIPAGAVVSRTEGFADSLHFKTPSDLVAYLKGQGAAHVKWDTERDWVGEVYRPNPVNEHNYQTLRFYAPEAAVFLSVPRLPDWSGHAPPIPYFNPSIDELPQLEQKFRERVSKKL